MRVLFVTLVAAFRDRASDVACTLISHPSAWTDWALAWLAAWALVRPAPLAATLHTAVDQHTARWGEAMALWWAGWLDAHRMPRVAARVLVINGLA